MADTDETDNYLFILINKSMILKVYNILCNSIKNKTLKIKISHFKCYRLFKALQNYNIQYDKTEIHFKMCF